MRIVPIDNLDTFFESLAENQQRADAQVEPWQSEMKDGDHFVHIVDMDGPVAIYGVIEDSKYEEDLELYNEPHMKNYRMCRCWSILCPEGELGSIHVATIQKKLSPSQFNLASQSDWPSDRRLRQIVELS
jgi:hypothetical protein